MMKKTAWRTGFEARSQLIQIGGPCTSQGGLDLHHAMQRRAKSIKRIKTHSISRFSLTAMQSVALIKFRSCSSAHDLSPYIPPCSRNSYPLLMTALSITWYLYASPSHSSSVLGFVCWMMVFHWVYIDCRSEQLFTTPFYLSIKEMGRSTVAH